MQVPPTEFPAGWYTGAPTPGELGPAILAGHVDWAGKPGVFLRLHDLKTDDEVTVARQDGSAAVFRVTQVKEYPKNDFPTDVVYGAPRRPAADHLRCALTGWLTAMTTTSSFSPTSSRPTPPHPR